jgi:hypothetical protein
VSGMQLVGTHSLMHVVNEDDPEDEAWILNGKYLLSADQAERLSYLLDGAVELSEPVTVVSASWTSGKTYVRY